MKIIHTINPLNIPETESCTFPVSEAARAIVFNADKSQIAMQYAANHGYHKLPGGGLEQGEDVKQALKRECEEELGFDIEIDDEVGAIVEYRKNDTEELRKTSYCFTAHIIGEQRALNLDAGELIAGFVVEWLALDDAIIALEKEIKEMVAHRNNQYILPRDLFLLNYVQMYHLK